MSILPCLEGKYGQLSITLGLSHKIRVIGSVNDECGEEIPACEAGFDTGKYMSIITLFRGILWIYISKVK